MYQTSPSLHIEEAHWGLEMTHLTIHTSLQMRTFQEIKKKFNHLNYEYGKRKLPATLAEAVLVC